MLSRPRFVCVCARPWLLLHGRARLAWVAECMARPFRVIHYRFKEDTASFQTLPNICLLTNLLQVMFQVNVLFKRFFDT